MLIEFGRRRPWNDLAQFSHRPGGVRRWVAAWLVMEASGRGTSVLVAAGVRGASESDAHPDVSNDVEWQSTGLTITVSTSCCAATGWCPPHEDQRFGIALPRYGAWRRRIDGVEQFVDPNTGFFRRRGDVTEVAHFTNDTHTGTIIDVDPELATPVLAELEQASGPFVVSPQVDVAHRLLAAAVRGRHVDDVTVQERTLSLLSAVLDHKHPRFSGHSRRATTTARRRIVDEVCEALQRTPRVSLVDVAKALHYSPFHVSRVFREVMGVTISSYRIRLRVHEVLWRLEGGERDLSRVAADAGFSDHSHMTRTMVAYCGHRPAALRALLRQTTG